MTSKFYLFIIWCILTLFLFITENFYLSMLFCIVIIILLIDLYKDSNTYSTNDFGYGYYGNNPNHYYYDDYGCCSSYQSSSSSSWWYENKKKQEKEIMLDIFKQIKPNMNIILDTEENTQHMLEQKSKDISEIIEINNDTTKPTIDMTEIVNLEEIKEVEKKNTTINSFIIIDNDAEINNVRKSIYDSIIEYLDKNSYGIAVKTIILQGIAFIDVVEELGNVVIYLKDKNLFSKHFIQTDKLFNNIKLKCSKIKNIEIEEYKFVSIYDYYTSNSSK